MQRDVRAGERVQELDPEAEQGVDEAADRLLRRRQPDEQRGERDRRARHVGERPAAAHIPVRRGGGGDEDDAGETGVEEGLLDQRGATASAPAANTKRALARTVREDQAQDRERRRHDGEQLAGREDRADRDGAAQQRGEQTGDPARARPLDGTREQRDPDHERDRGNRAQRPHAALPAERRELEQHDQERRAIHPVGAVERAVPARPVLRDVGEAALVPAERRRQVRHPQHQREQEAAAERPPGPQALGQGPDPAEDRRPGHQSHLVGRRVPVAWSGTCVMPRRSRGVAPARRLRDGRLERARGRDVVGGLASSGPPARPGRQRKRSRRAVRGSKPVRPRARVSAIRPMTTPARSSAT